MSINQHLVEDAGKLSECQHFNSDTLLMFEGMILDQYVEYRTKCTLNDDCYGDCRQCYLDWLKKRG